MEIRKLDAPEIFRQTRTLENFSKACCNRFWNSSRHELTRHRNMKSHFVKIAHSFKGLRKHTLTPGRVMLRFIRIIQADTETEGMWLIT